MDRSDSIVLAAGCFWCVEAVFNSLKGVTSVVPGYSGGSIKNPCYKEVCSGRTGHAEVVKVDFNPSQISLSVLYDVFFASHNPTTLNRQGNDVGTQYRSAIFPNSEDQKQQAVDAIERAKSEWDEDIVTSIEELTVFYLAEDYHHNYFDLNEEAPYCDAVIAPKLQKFRRRFPELLK